MENKLLAIIFLLSTHLFGQQMNQVGHFILPLNDSEENKIHYTYKKGKIESGTLTFEGNSIFETPSGFITLSGGDENANSILRLYSSYGHELFSHSFAQTINFALSPSKNFCAFHDGKQIWLLDIEHKKLKAYQGSRIFSINDNGELLWFNHHNSTINYRDFSIQLNEPVYKIISYKDKLIYITKTSLYCLENNKPVKLFTTSEGRIFDIAAFNDKLFVSVKKELKDEFVFTSYRTTNLVNFISGEESHYALAHSTNKLKSVNIRGNMPPGELIRDPLNFYSDTVYQAVGNSYNELQDYGDPYLHPGVDLMGTYLQDVHSVKNGVIKAILTTGGNAYWRIGISNEDIAGISQGYLYAHLEKTSIPYAEGDLVKEGDVIAQLVNFPVAGFVHCHFARIQDQGSTWNGEWWTFDNPLSYMTNLVDNIAPQFEKTIGNDVFAFRDKDGIYLSPDKLKGNVSVISKLYDRINSDWHIDVNTIRYNVSPLNSPHTLLLDSSSYQYGFFNDYYFGGSSYQEILNIIYSRDFNCYSDSDYDIRDFYHIVTNSDGNGVIDSNDADQFFNTKNLADGSYIFRVLASDPSGNMSMDSMIITIDNFITDANDISKDASVVISPNPFKSRISLSINNRDPEILSLTIRNITGQIVYSSSKTSTDKFISKELDLDFLNPGIYLLDINLEGEHLIKKVVKE